MKLLLTSSGITNKSIEGALSELVEKPFAKLNLAFIPTASTIEKIDKKWLVDDLYNAKKLGFANFFITDISAVPENIWRLSWKHPIFCFLEEEIRNICWNGSENQD